MSIAFHTPCPKIINGSSQCLYKHASVWLSYISAASWPTVLPALDSFSFYLTTLDSIACADNLFKSCCFFIWCSLITVVNSHESCFERLSAEHGSQRVLEQLEMHSLLGVFCFEVPVPLKPFWLLPKALSSCRCWKSPSPPSTSQLPYGGGLWACDRRETFGFWMISGKMGSPVTCIIWHNLLKVKDVFQGCPLLGHKLAIYFFLAWLVGKGVEDWHRQQRQLGLFGILLSLLGKTFA